MKCCKYALWWLKVIFKIHKFYSVLLPIRMFYRRGFWLSRLGSSGKSEWISFFPKKEAAGSPNWRGRLSTVDLLVLASLYLLIFYTENNICVCYKTTYLYEEVNCTEPFPSVKCSLEEVSVHFHLPKHFTGHAIELFSISLILLTDNPESVNPASLLVLLVKQGAFP